MKYLRLLVFFGIVSTSPYLTAGEINFSGFATMAGGISLDSDETLLGYDDTIGFNENSLFGLQASSQINDKWGATVQIIARGSEEWNTDFAWAYLSYDASDEWRLLFGRQRVPFYTYSDFIDASYAYHWITAPETVYNLPFDDFDGIGSIYTSTLGDFDSTFHVTYGRNTDALVVSGEKRDGSDVSNLLSVAWTLNYDWLTLRTGYSSADVTIPVADFQPLVDGWIGAGFPDVASNIEIVDDKFAFMDFALIVDYENFLIVAEATNLDEDETNFIGQQDNFYVSFGYRMNDVLIHFTHSENDGKNTTQLLDSVPLGIDPGLDFLAVSTEAAILSQNTKNSTDTIGLRWDFDSGTAFKIEYSKYSDDLSSGALAETSLLRFAVTTVF